MNLKHFSGSIWKIAWRIIPLRKWLITMASFRPLTGVIPFPNGRSPWLINGGDPNNLRPSWDDPPSMIQTRGYKLINPIFEVHIMIIRVPIFQVG